VTACTGRPGYLPRFQPQNPALSGDRFGWVGCTAYAAGMASDFDSCGKTILTGKQVRQLSSEPIPDPASPGLNLRQIDAAANRYGIDLDVQYRLPWDDVVRRIDKGEGAVLQGATGPFLSTKYRSTAGDINHAIFVPPGWGAMDPAADGRRNEYWKYDGSAYSRDLLRRFAGHLVLDVVNGHANRLGEGFAYAAFTRDRRSTWTWEHGAGKFVLWSADDLARTCKPVKTQRTGGTEAHTCTPPRLYIAADGSSRTLVRMLAGAYKDRYVASRFAEEVP
jgi:hypothetical protein